MPSLLMVKHWGLPIEAVVAQYTDKLTADVLKDMTYADVVVR